MTFEQISSLDFQILYVSELAAILGVESSAIIINNILPVNVRRKLIHSINDTGVRVIVKGYRLTYTVTVQNTTISALSSALIASSAPLNAILVDSGYTSVVLGTPVPRYLDSPTTNPTYISSKTPGKEKSFPLAIIITIVAILSVFIAISAYLYREKMWGSKLLCQRISFCCIPISSRTSLARQ